MALDSSTAARQAARSILSEGRFHSSSVPDPLHGVLVRIGQLVDDPLSAVGRLFHRLGSVLPGGVAGAWAAAAGLVIVLTGGLALHRARTRLANTETASEVAHPLAGDLERAAERAEREGRWDEAVRLRFRAGILRLGELDGYRHTDATPNHSLARMLGSESFDQLTRRFDEIVYGGQEATSVDAEAQRRAWPELIAERGR
jgi:hypothetical protein